MEDNMSTLVKLLLSWIIAIGIIFGYYFILESPTFNRSYPPEVQALGKVASISELTKRFDGKSITTYGTVINLYSTKDGDMEFLLWDSQDNQMVFCKASSQVLKMKPDRKKLLFVSRDNGTRLYVRGLVKATFSSSEINVKQVFSP